MMVPWRVWSVDVRNIICSQYLVMKWFAEFVEEARQQEGGGGVHAVLCKLASLYGVWCLEKRSVLLYQGM